MVAPRGSVAISIARLATQGAVITTASAGSSSTTGEGKGKGKGKGTKNKPRWGVKKLTKPKKVDWVKRFIMEMEQKIMDGKHITAVELRMLGALGEFDYMYSGYDSHDIINTLGAYAEEEPDLTGKSLVDAVLARLRCDYS